MVDLYIDAETERESFDVSSVMSVDKCKEYAGALMKLVVGLKSNSWSAKDFLASFLDKSASDVVAKMTSSGSDEIGQEQQSQQYGDDSSQGGSSPRPRLSTATRMMKPDYKRQR